MYSLRRSATAVLFFLLIVSTSVLVPPVTVPAQDMQDRCEQTMRRMIDSMYDQLAAKIDGLDPLPSDFSIELGNLDTYAQEYVSRYQPAIPIKNRLRELRFRHAQKRKGRLDQINSVIRDMRFLRGEYLKLERKLERKRKKVGTLFLAKLIMDVILLPLDEWNFIAERIISSATSVGSVQFVPEGGLGATTAGRRLGQIDQEMRNAHKKLKEILFTKPKNRNELFPLLRQGEVQAEKCAVLSLKIIQALEKGRENRLKIAENRLLDHLEDIIAKTDRILAQKAVLAQCVIAPPQVRVDRNNPHEQVQVSYLYQSGLRTEVDHTDITYSTDTPSVAGVDAQGRVTGLANGRTELQAVCKKSGHTCSIPVVVHFPATPGTQVPVPFVLGMPWPKADQQMTKAGLIASFKSAAKRNPKYLPDMVIDQSPKGFTLVPQGSSVDLSVNPSPQPTAQLVDIMFENADPPYLPDTGYTLAAVVTQLSPNHTYTYTWYINGRKTGTGQSMGHSFPRPGKYTLKVVMTSSDPRSKGELTKQVTIVPPEEQGVDFTISPRLEGNETYSPADRVTFTQKCTGIYNISEYRWYVDGEYVGSGTQISRVFNDPGSYEITLGLRRGSNFDELSQSKTLTVGDPGIGVLGTWRNRFKARGGNENLSICSEYYVGGSGRWSKQCTRVRNIGPVEGYALGTGPQSDGYNTGFLVYAPRDGGKLRFEVYHFNFNTWKGVLHYSGTIPRSEDAEAQSLSISCQANVATALWSNRNGSSCSIKIWKFKDSQLLAHTGIEDPICSKPAIDPQKLKRCRDFARTAVAQQEENLDRECSLQGPEWHTGLERHRKWCLAVSGKEARDLTRHRDEARKACGKTWCAQYARQAVAQNEKNLSNSCGFSGRRWQSDFDAHYAWCLQASRGAAQAETRTRESRLQICLDTRKGVCRQYATQAVEANNDNLGRDCGYCGPAWQSSFDAHYQWCLNSSQQEREAETRHRTNLLKKCRQVSAGGERTFFEPCFKGYRLDNCLNFGTNCEKPAADRFCQEQGFTQAQAWKLEKARPTYVLGDDRICDADYCAGFRYITCSGYTHPENTDPVCTITKPDSGVDLRPGQNTGFRAEASDADKDKLTYTWAFEGGKPSSWESWQGSVYAVRWPDPGTYTSTLTVTDGKGGTCRDSVIITVQDPGGGYDCSEYVQTSLRQNRENLDKGCGFGGQLWHSDRDRHLRFCRQSDAQSLAQTMDQREQALQECSGNISQGGLTCEIISPQGIAFINAGQGVSFSGQARGAPSKDLSYFWKFSEYGAQPKTSTRKSPGQVTFQWAGRYRPRLTVTDAQGSTCQVERDVLVHDPQDPREFCEGYAEIAADLHRKNLDNQCALSGAHWHDDQIAHQKWCQSASVAQAQAGLARREKELRRCLEGTGSEPPSQEPPAPDTKHGSGTGADQPPPQVSAETQKAYQEYIQAYNALTGLMAAGLGNSPQAQEAYAQYQKAKAAYEATLQGQGAGEPDGGEPPEQPKTQKSTHGHALQAVADTHVYAYAYRGWNRANWGAYEVLGSGWHPLGGEKRTFIRFDLSGIRAKQVGSALLQLYHYHTGGENTLNIGVHRVTSPWTEGTGTYKPSRPARGQELSWMHQPGFDSRPVSTFKPGPQPGYVQVDITALVNQWLSGTPNYGLVLKAAGELTSRTPESSYGFRARECQDADKRPVLILSGQGLDHGQNVPGKEPADIRDGIHVLSATYGRNCGAKSGNVTQHIADQCNGKSSCRYTVDHRIIGDPAYGCAKTYIVTYRCGNDPRVHEKALPAEAGWGDKSVILECGASVFGSSTRKQIVD